MTYCAPTGSVFDGMSREQLQAALASAQSALIELQTGRKVVTATYAQGDGNKSVTYQMTSIAGASALIYQLQAKLGLRPARRGRRIVW